MVIFNAKFIYHSIIKFAFVALPTIVTTIILRFFTATSTHFESIDLSSAGKQELMSVGKKTT